MTRPSRLPLNLAMALLATSCNDPKPFNWLGETMTDGRTLAALVPQSDTAALLLLDPSHCFTCGGEIASWRGWASRSATRSVTIVLLREPSADETAELIRQRIPVAGIIRPTNTRPSPTVLFYTDGEMRDSASGESRARALMGRWYQ